MSNVKAFASYVFFGSFLRDVMTRISMSDTGTIEVTVDYNGERVKLRISRVSEE